MKKVLVKFDDNWADEMDVEGLWVTTEEKCGEFLSNLKQKSFNGEEIYIGTNESLMYESLEEVLRTLTIMPISDDFYENFKLYVGDTFGFDVRRLAEV